MTWVWTIGAVVLVSLLSLVGVVSLAFREGFLHRITLYLVSFAVGGLFGDAFIHLLPEAFARLGGTAFTSLYILGGLLLFFILEKFLRWRHCHDEECDDHPSPVVAMNLIGDGIHNLIDGVLIGASFTASVPIGIATTVAVILHEIPQELGDFGVLIHGGLTVRRALLFNYLSSLTAVAGATLSLLVGPALSGFTPTILAVTAGGFIYIAGSDLIPELHHRTDLRGSLGQLACICAGGGVMALLLLLE
jgi:zinc and cadmium transporter